MTENSNNRRQGARKGPSNVIGRNGIRPLRMKNGSVTRDEANRIRKTDVSIQNVSPVSERSKRKTRQTQKARREQGVTRRARFGAMNHLAHRWSGRRSARSPEESRVVSDMSPEADVRRKVKIFYLTLIGFSIAVIIIFSVLLKVKLKAIRTMPTDGNAHYQFEEHPRITLPATESIVEGAETENEFDDEMADDEDEQPTTSTQP